jgi:ATP-dependent Clp protease protease subunit
MKKDTNQPIRCFEGQAKPYEPFWHFRNVEEGQDPEMELYGYISEFSWDQDEITPKMFRDDLMRVGKGGPIKIRLNSYGGDVIAASLMSTIMRDYPGPITVQVDGIAASAATVVAVAGKKVLIQDTAYFMIHDPLLVFFMAALNIEDMTRLADSLQAVKEGIMNAYETKTGLSRTRLSKLMTDETWMDAQKALDLGFVDEILANPNTQSADIIPIQNVSLFNCLHNYSKIPAALWQPTIVQNQPSVEVSKKPALSDEEKREAESLRVKVNSILRKENRNG